MAGGYSSISSAEGSSMPEATAAAQMVQVVAPVTLGEGYSFQASYQGIVFPVTVPAGGVSEGQTIIVPFPSPTAASELTSFAAIWEGDVPHGQWKDGLCSCGKFSVLHPSLLNALFCPQILMAQVLTRMRMDWLGTVGPDYEWRMTFRRIVIIVIVYYVASSFLAPPSPDFEIDPNDGSLIAITPDVPLWQSVLYNAMSVAFGLYTLIVMIRLRRAVRDKYEIPEQMCHGYEDCCCVFWCGCCTMSQLARHTANYDERRAVCCSDTGLPGSSPPVMVV